MKSTSDCNCHERHNQTLGHYLGVTLLFCVGAVLWLGVSGRVKETYIASAMDLFKSLSALIVGGILAAWNQKGSRDETQITGGQKGPGSKVEMTETPSGGNKDAEV